MGLGSRVGTIAGLTTQNRQVALGNLRKRPLKDECSFTPLLRSCVYNGEVVLTKKYKGHL